MENHFDYKRLVRSLGSGAIVALDVSRLGHDLKVDSPDRSYLTLCGPISCPMISQNIVLHQINFAAWPQILPDRWADE